MKILFMGTPEFAKNHLQALVENGYDVVAVVSQCDKPKGRGHKLMPTVVKEYALSQGIPVYQPQTLKDHAFENELKQINPDIIVVVAYGRVLPEYILNYPKYGCINVHASLLPYYRGAAPIQWCIINGEKKSGVTTMYMEKGLDTGDMLVQEELEIGDDETASQLHDRLCVLGESVLCKTLEQIKSGTLVRTVQEHEKHTYAPMITKETAKIDFDKPVVQIKNLVRGMNSFPLAYTSYKGELMKVISVDAVVTATSEACENGTVIKAEGDAIAVKCSDGYINIRALQFTGGKRMSTKDYLKGHVIETGVVLGQ